MALINLSLMVLITAAEKLHVSALSSTENPGNQRHQIKIKRVSPRTSRCLFLGAGLCHDQTNASRVCVSRPPAARAEVKSSITARVPAPCQEKHPSQSSESQPVVIHPPILIYTIYKT